ncbi:MAG: hypothetical protein ACXVHB_06015 [Solirubrobacteraceae bacterium]
MQNNPDLKTYKQWALEGHSVIQGQRAPAYLVSPDMAQGIALFRRDQVEPFTGDRPEIAEWTDVITADEWRAARAKPKRVPGQRKVRIGYDYADNAVTLWCGPNPEVIKRVKRTNWRWNPHLHRWVKRWAEPELVARALEKDGQFVQRDWDPAEYEAREVQ